MNGVITISHVKLIRNLRTGYHRNRTRIWIEPTALEAAGFDVGDGIRQTVTNDAVILTRTEERTRIISKRKLPSWSHARPLFESCNDEITAIFREREKIDLLINDGMIVIRKERSFDLFIIEKPMLQGRELKKLRLYSAPSGGGMATAALVDTDLYEAVGGVDISPFAVDAYRNNFRDGCFYLGSLTSKHSDYVPKADACWLSPSCTKFSGLGTMTNGLTEGHGPHYARLVLATGAEIVMIEQVPQYFKSESYRHLKRLLQPFFSYMHEIVIDAYDAGSVASRTRGYAVFTRNKTDFAWPQLPKLPEHRRSAVSNVIGKDWDRGDWKPIEGTVMASLLRKEGQNNFKAEKNHTLVGLDSKRVSAFPFSYGKIQVTSSYLKHPEKELWRMFRSDEMLSFLNIPDWYQFPEWMGEGDRVKLAGQSIAGNVVKAIGIEAAVAVMGSRYRKIASAQQTETIIESIDVQTYNTTLIEGDSQLAFNFIQTSAS